MICVAQKRAPARTLPRPWAQHSAALLVTCAVSALICVGCGNGGTHEAGTSDAAIRTLAYVVTECHDGPEGSSGRQRVEVLRGDASAPLIIKEVGGAFAVESDIRLCAFVARNRWGLSLLNIGVLERLGVSPDGSRVVFEVTDAFSDPGRLPEHEKGIFVVRADGSGLRRVAPPSRDPPFRVLGLAISSIGTLFAFSPDGRTIAYTDLGPGPDGTEAVQIVTLDLDTGARMQVTRLPVSPPLDPTRPATLGPFFLDAHRIAFFSTSNPTGLNPEQRLVPFVVQRDGTSLSRGPQPAAVSGGGVFPQFVITGPAPSPALLSTAEEPVIVDGSAVLDVFLLDGDNLVQLTAFGRTDITDAVLSADGRRVFFNASADACAEGKYNTCTGSNPFRNCQIFSVDRTGGDLRQLTAFDEGGISTLGCYYDARGQGCAANLLAQDPHTGTLVFYSNCNPFGVSGFRGSQIYAMRPNGTGLRQLTATRGRFSDNGFDAIELPGQLAYSSSSTRPLR